MQLSPEISSLLAQVPVVGIFVLFVLILNDRNNKAIERRDALMRDFLAEQRKQDREIISSLTLAIKEIHAALNSHDDKTDQAIATMKERTGGSRRVMSGGSK